MTKNKNKTLYMGLINLSGVQGPFKLEYDPDFGVYNEADYNCYWDSTGEYGSPGPGFVKKDCYIRFSSFDKNEVKLFLKGAKALKSVLIQSVLY